MSDPLDSGAADTTKIGLPALLMRWPQAGHGPQQHALPIGDFGGPYDEGPTAPTSLTDSVGNYAWSAFCRTGMVGAT